jgi:hypothetical protein
MLSFEGCWDLLLQRRFVELAFRLGWSVVAIEDVYLISFLCKSFLCDDCRQIAVITCRRRECVGCCELQKLLKLEAYVGGPITVPRIRTQAECV